MEETDEWINDLEDTVLEGNQAEQKGKRIMQNGNRLRDLSDSIQHNNMYYRSDWREVEISGKFTLRNDSWKNF